MSTATLERHAMNTTLRLDSGALAALIAASSETELELQRAVVAEVVRKVVFKDMPEALQKASPQLAAELIAKMRDDATVRGQLDAALVQAIQVWDAKAGNYGRGNHVLRPDLKELLTKEVGAVIDTQARSAINGVWERFEARLEERAAAYERGIEQRVQAAVSKVTAANIEAQVQARLDAIKAGL